MKPHIAICSINFDKSPEGVCTGLLTRALLEYGFKVTLLTSTKADTRLHHPSLKIYTFHHKPREPRALFKLLAKIKGDFPHNFYMWGKKVSQHEFSVSDLPDVIYGRAWPYSSLIPALNLAQRYKLPLITHLSDPVPPPNETYNPKLSNHLQSILDYSSAVTFTNEETIEYQSQFNSLVKDTTYVLPHVAPLYNQLPKPSEPNRYYYIGAIGNRKSVLDMTLAGFAKHQNHYPKAEFAFVNPNAKDITPFIHKNNISHAVTVLPFAEDICDVYRPAGALISLEPKVDKPIWTLTKTAHYLLTNRKILALTSPGSPTERLLKNFPESCIVVTDYSVQAISKGFDKLLQIEPSEKDFKHRIDQMACFKSENIAAEFAKICKQALE